LMFAFFSVVSPSVTLCFFIGRGKYNLF